VWRNTGIPKELWKYVK